MLPVRPPRSVAIASLLAALLVASFHPASGTSTSSAAPARDQRATAVRAPEWGAYVDGMVADPSRLTEFETMLGAKTSIASYYTGYGDVFPDTTTRTLAAGGSRKVLVSWHLGGTRFNEWTAGRHNLYLDKIAAAARLYPYPLWVRPWPEMNGDWQPFQPTAAGERPEGGTYAEFKAAWRYVVTYLRGKGATNLRWVFNPTTDTYAETTPVAKIYPGKAFVDVLGLDGFNWGQDDGWGRWLSFDQIFRAQYANLTALDAKAPVWICEFGSKEPLASDGSPIDELHSKADWMTAALDRRTMPRVRALIYFQAAKERDWRVDSSPGSLAATKVALARLLKRR